MNWSVVNRLKAKRKAEGVCIYCGGKLDTEYLYCSKCNEKVNKMQNNWILEKHNKGYCANCNKILDREGWFCIDCANDLKLKARIRNAERKANGLCIQCGRPTDGKTYCQRCLDMRMDRYYNNKNKTV